MTREATPPPLISIVVPVYLGESCLAELHRRAVESVTPLLDGRTFELILVDDASPDDSWERARGLASADARVKALRFTRNFGQHHAITAGLQSSRGDWVVVMDCDLQDRPEDIKKLYATAREGYDCVVGLRAQSGDPLLRRLISRGFYALFGFLVGRSIDPRIGSFRIISRRAVDRYLEFHERVRLFGNLMEWLAFPTADVEVSHDASARGYSGYTAGKLLKLAFESALLHSERLLRITVYGGFLCAAGSFGFGLYVFVSGLFYRSPIQGWTSLIVSIFFFSGVMITMLGLIGLYIGKTLEEIRARPLYVVRDSLNLAVER